MKYKKRFRTGKDIAQEAMLIREDEIKIKRAITQGVYAKFDGCVEPINPGGTASYGGYILEKGKRLHKIAEIYTPMPGELTTNNIAEYAGLRAILEYLISLNKQLMPVVIMGDSKLVIEQMLGKWKIKNGRYKSIALQCRELTSQFRQIDFFWIPREKNRVADRLSKCRLLKMGIVLSNWKASKNKRFFKRKKAA